MNPKLVRAEILKQVSARTGRSACPSEVARALAPDDWRPLMTMVRNVAAELQEAGLIRVTQKGREVDLNTACGPVRLAEPQVSPTPSGLPRRSE